MLRALRLFLPFAPVLLLGANGTPLGAASAPPDLRFRTLVGSRADVHFHEDVETQARVAMALVDEVLPKLEQRYGTRLGARVHVVLVDESDDPNGFTYVFPYPIVRVSLARPDGADELGAYESWLRLVLTHELAHAVHLDQARGIARLGRVVLGRAPFVFPNSVTPTWLVEGLATYEETRLTSYGRGRNPDTRMVLRMAALQDRWPREDEAVLGLDLWPGGHAPYLFGESFLRDLTARFGDDTLPRLTNTHAAWPLPFLDELTAAKVTGASFRQRWTEWRKAQAEMARQTARDVAQAGATTMTALTRRGVRQVAPRLSPNGTTVAYVSVTLDRSRQIRLLEADGTLDGRPLIELSGGTSLSWTPDGARLIFDQTDFHGTYRWWSDLYGVNVATGAIERLTRGLRASEPDVSPDGDGVLFVRRSASRSELAWLDLASGRSHDLTASPPGTVWSHPRIHPRGGHVVASRLSPGGWVDLALVDVASGVVEDLTHDRARDVEPTWAPHGRRVVFRSDRDGTPNLWSLDVGSRAIRRVTRVLGGAFGPELAPTGETVLFSSYSAAGYDLASAPFEEGARVSDYADAYPPPVADPPPSVLPVHRYRGWRTLWPRYWSPYASSLSSNVRLGATTSSIDPLFRHTWFATAFYSLDTNRPGAEGAYLYDRFRVTFGVAGSVDSDPLAVGTLTTRELALQATLPIERRWNRNQSVSVAWRVQHQRAESTEDRDGTVSLGAVEGAWTLGSSRRYPYAISPVDGSRLRLAVTREARWLGSDFELTKLTLDARTYLRLGRSTHTLSLRAGTGTTIGEKRLTSTFAIGGFPAGSLVDLLGTSPAVLRGYEERAFRGRHVAYANAEYRFPLLHPQRGLWTAPAFVRHVHGALFVDAGHAWTGSWGLRDIQTSIGVALGADTYLGHALPFTGTLGIARGLGDAGITQVYARAGLAF